MVIEVHAMHLLVGSLSYENLLSMLEKGGYEVFEVVGFRTSSQLNLLKLEGPAREGFTSYDRWSTVQRSTERLIYARFIGTVS